MEQAQRRTAALLAVRARVAEHGVRGVDDATALQLAMAAGTRCEAPLLEVMFSVPFARRVTGRVAKAIALAPAELDALFGVEAVPVRDGGVGDVAMRDAAFSEQEARLAGALRCTVLEPAPSRPPIGGASRTSPPTSTPTSTTTPSTSCC